MTYRAASGRTALLVVGATAVLSVAVSAGTANAVALNGDSEVKLGSRGRGVLEDGQPGGTVAVSNTKVERSVVAPWVR